MDNALGTHYSVGKEQARTLAFQSLALYFRSEGSCGLLDSALWSLSNLPGLSQEELMGSEPIKILDLDGRLLFWQWLVRLRDGRDLAVRAAADTRLGAPVVSVSASQRPGGVMADFNRTRSTCACFDHDTPEIWLCFEDPRIGLFVKQSGDLIRLIKLGEEDVLTFHRNDLPPSPLEFPESLESWLRRGKRLERFWEGANSLEEAASRAAASEVCYQLPNMCFVSQVNKDFCAPATAEMILGFHGIGKDQREIAAYMGTVISDPEGRGGTEPFGEIRGYETFLGSGSAYRDEVPEFIEASQEIGDSQAPGRPLKVGTNKHAMAVVGWQLSVNLTPPMGELYLYDPEHGRVWAPFAGKFKSYVYVRP